MYFTLSLCVCVFSIEEEGMNLVFAEGTRAPSAKHFAIPTEVKSRLRARDPVEKEHVGGTEEAGKRREGELSDAVAPRGLPESLVKYIQRCIEYGQNSTHVEEGLQSTNSLTDSTRRLAALQSALSILCHIAAMDKSYCFISSQSTAPRKPPFARTSNNNNRGRNRSQTTKVISDSFFSLTDIYTTVRSLKLEYEDVLKQQKSGSGKQQYISVNSAAAAVSVTEARVDASLALLEFTVVQMILNFDRSRDISVEYVADMLRTMPQIFATEKRPLTVLQEDDGKHTERKRFRDGEHVVDDVANAANSIVLRALQALKSKDCFRTLSRANRSNIVRVSDGSLPVSFDGMMTKALDGGYRWRGIYGALHDMKMLLYGLYATAPPDQEEHITLTRLQFEHSVREEYDLFLRRTGLRGAVEDPLLPERTMFDVNPLPADADSTSYTDTQLKSLKLLDLIREVDSNSWFEYPVFDMANIELSSIEKWVRGSIFGMKSNRDAFLALRDVLEQMVDSCVLSYGPTSPFSQVITLMRQRLVDAAREVSLL
ncbi:hypothetical protein MOQ_000444 [Trypanosoma cruzi marinkellei]|uniref:Uncharacterized protein n=1 Tax=Trypanosoma cruzi marinkellei TaxID=85056 RepID=K2NIU5_TRYCR|nr:hypothetical protein MOQ_000444 [Trypanosoma cruzi marinkellei]